MEKKLIITGFKNCKNKKKFLNDIESLLNNKDNCHCGNKNGDKKIQSFGGGNQLEKIENCKKLFKSLYSTDSGESVFTSPSESLAPKNSLRKLTNNCQCVDGTYLYLILFKVTSENFPDLKYSIHGLWPNSCVNGKVEYLDKINFVKNDGSNSFQIQNISIDTLQKANKFWFSYGGSPTGAIFETQPPQFSNNASFWAHEWHKHGTYLQTLNKFNKITPEEYMVTTIDLYKQAIKKNEKGVSLADKFYNKSKGESRIPLNLNFELYCSNPSQNYISNPCC